MTEDQDNAGEVIASAVRVALTAAGQLAEQAARRREAELRQAERDSTAQVTTLQSQLAAERELALRSVRDILQRGGAVDELVQVWAQARSWDDPTMNAERARLEDRIRARFGIDAPRGAGDRSPADQATAGAVIGRDIELQAADARQRQTSPDRVGKLHGELVAAGVENEAAVALALAAESHPIPVTRAARRPQAAPTGKSHGPARRGVAELQPPGR